MNIPDKVALVTGGALRIGRALCLALAAKGAQVVIHYHRSASAAAALKAEIERLSVKAWTVQADLSDPLACEGLMDRVLAMTGTLDILINNAAVFHKDKLQTSTWEKMMAEFTPNLFAPLCLMRTMAARVGQGTMVNLLDRRISGLDTGCVPYVLSKKALADLTALAALELAPRFRVNGVAPGAILPPPGEDAAYLYDKAGPVPLQMHCTPEQVAQAVISLVENDAITGQIVYVDGGQHLSAPSEYRSLT